METHSYLLPHPQVDVLSAIALGMAAIAWRAGDIVKGAISGLLSILISLNPADPYTGVGFGGLGRGLQIFGFSQAALCIALILGSMREANRRRGLPQTHGNLTEFASGPPLLLLGLAVFSAAWSAIAKAGVRRAAAAQTLD